MKISIYYISTGPYNEYFSNFLDGVHNFFPNQEKVVNVISDGLREYEGYHSHNINLKICPRINHYPWPIITLYKMWHILENFDNECDFHCYFNANSTINNNDPCVWFDENKMNCSYHGVCRKPNIGTPMDFANDINPNSAAYIDNYNYRYVQGGFLFANTNIFRNMCECVVRMLSSDAKKHIYPQWHDESYFNRWCYDNDKIVNRKHIMTVYTDALSDETFVLLKNKTNKINSFKSI